MHQAERGLFELRQGRPLYVTAPAGSSEQSGVLLATVETLSRQTLESLRSVDAALVRLIVTHHRARVMGLANGAFHQATSLKLNGKTKLEQILRLCITAGNHSDLEDLDPRPATALEVGGLTLARISRVLPAVVGVCVNETPPDLLQAPLSSGAILSVTTAEIESLATNAQVEVTHVSDGPVPLEHAEHARFMVFREASGLLEHVAVVIGQPEQWPDPVPVRLHSACLTGDLFGSLRCDCGEQLRGSLGVFTARGGGVLLYLAQEGRGIGLGNKMRAYSLQDAGFDTVDADSVLGFGDDERRYDAAVAMLQHLQVERVQLLTNNPAKVQALVDGGIDVVDRQPLFGTLNRYNLPYVKAKIDRAGHWLADMLAGGLSDK